MAYYTRRRVGYRKRTYRKRTYRKRAYRKRAYPRRTYRKRAYGTRRYKKKRSGVAVVRPTVNAPVSKWTLDHLPTDVLNYAAQIKAGAAQIVPTLIKEAVVKMETDPVVNGRTERETMRQMNEGVVYVG